MSIKSITATMLLVTLLLVVSKQAYSFDGWLNIHITASHAKRTYMDKTGNNVEYNQNNFGLGVSLPYNSNIDVRAGFYDNSFNATSVYAGADLYVNPSRFVTVGVNTGVATGYENTPAHTSTLAPMLMPHITFKMKNFRTEIGYVPSFDPKQVAFWTFSVGTRF
ncbi:MAG: hypothetical protein LJE83_10630 [Gammaproteobacteria bacterium]|nr:hypothetical protein [Gammaproteobacteria bacterium]